LYELIWKILDKKLEEKEMDLKGTFSNVTGISSKVQELLKSVNFPASKQDIINKAKEKGVDNNIISMLGKLTDMKFQSPADVMNEVNKIK
jgi:radical SAM superfamily enzyme YgiQ (UPF0313 family)